VQLCTDNTNNVLISTFLLQKGLQSRLPRLISSTEVNRKPVKLKLRVVYHWILLHHNITIKEQLTGLIQRGMESEEVCFEQRLTILEFSNWQIER